MSGCGGAQASERAGRGNDALRSTDWIRDLFAALDRGGVPALAPYLHEDVLFRFGSHPAGRGRQAFADAWVAMSPHIQSMTHDIVEAWRVDDTAICHGSVRYTLIDNGTVRVPFANVFKLRDGRISEYLIYVDASAVFGVAHPSPDT